MKPQPKTVPITDTFSGDIGLWMEGVSDHHFPAAYGDFSCVVELMQVEMTSFQSMHLKLIFAVGGDPQRIGRLYEEEGWKFLRTESILKKHPEAEQTLRTPAPIFALMLNKYLQVVGGTCRVKYQNPAVVCDQSAELLMLPDSFPPLTEKRPKDKHHYYHKKATVFYTDLHVGERYEFDIDLEANGPIFEFAPLFPYGRVEIQKTETNGNDYVIEPLGVVVRPTVSDQFPDWYEAEMKRKEAFEPREPHFKPASPWRGESPLFDVLRGVSKPETKEEVRKILERLTLDLGKPIVLQNYDTVRFAFGILIPPDKNIEIIIRSIRRPLPTRIYEQMQRLPHYQDVLVRYDIFNLGAKKLRLRVETEILDYTDKAVRVVFVHALNNRQGRKAREVVTQCPRLKRGVMESVIKPEKATMLCKVINEDTKDVLHEETINIDLLANDEMIWELNDVRSNTKYNLHEFVCAWITPRDSEGLIEAVRRGAALRRPSRAFGDGAGTLSDIESHARAVYEHLAESGLVYVSQPFSAMPTSNGQRVVLPEVTLRNKAGNCIDLVILFASILEGAGYYSLIFLTKDHAFVGWGNKDNPREMIFLETTVIGHADFDEAKRLGREAFEKDFTLVGLPPDKMLPVAMMGMIRGNYMVDTREVRYSGRIASRK